jgi:cardiolipin synthase
VTYFIVAHLFVVAGALLAAISLGHVLLQRRAPASTMAWLLVIVLIPYVGVPLYLMIGGRKLRSAVARKRRMRLAPPPIPSRAKTDHPIEQLLRSLGNPPACGGNRLTLCGTGEVAYASLVELIESAQRTLHITMFILHPDEVGREIVRRLAARARAGVEVRLMLDAVGSMRTSRMDLAPLTDAGGRVAYFMPVLHLPFRGRSNLRNHRKLVVADGRRALAGGMNIAMEYMGPAAMPHRWRDLAFVVEGPAAAAYEGIFRSDWEFAAGDSLGPESAAEAGGVGDAVVQVVPSGPDVPGDALYHAIVSAIYAAQARFWVVTPYFIPDESLIQALGLAARRGVDVRIVVPDRSNHPLTDLARGAYLRDLNAAGAKVLRFPLGMVHAKAVVADDCLAMIGSANMDPRSLFLDFEVMLVAYTPHEVAATAAWIDGLAAASLTGVAPATTTRQMMEGLARLAGPLL